VSTEKHLIRDRYEWTASDLVRQFQGFGKQGASASRPANGNLEVSIPQHPVIHLSLVSGNEDELKLVWTSEGLQQEFSWKPTISKWINAASESSLYDALNQILVDNGLDSSLVPIEMLRLNGLKTYFHTEQGVVKAVDGLTVQIRPGCTLGLVGESGSGKSVTSLSVMGLLPEFTARIPEGEIVFMGKDLLSFTAKNMRSIRGSELAMIFQEPMTSLNPVYRVGAQVAEAIMLHEKTSKKEAWKRTIDLFHEVGIPDPETRARSYPHEMSGGQKQRVMIAMALACNPSLLIADEPTTALDVTIQKQILDLLGELRDNRGMAILFITHDLGVIAEIADDVAVMYRGKLCEYGGVLEVFANPAHPYTRGLLACRPRLDSPYQLLPTVADYLETRVENGEIRVSEIQMTEERKQELYSGGRTKFVRGDGPPVLEVRDLHVWFPLKKDILGRVQSWVKAVNGISFDVYSGQTLGLVGESGCGKTTTGRAILRLVQPQSGSTLLEKQDLSILEKSSSLGPKLLQSAAAAILLFSVGLMAYWLSVVIDVGADNAQLLPPAIAGFLFIVAVGISGFSLGRISSEEQDIRRRLQIIFQDPYASLNPRLTVEQTVTEPMKVHRIGASHEERVQRAGDLLEEVGLPREYLKRFPHEFSGGQRQRICIARTLSLNPSVIICDESVSALDVSVQAQVLNLMKKLQIKYGLTYIFISHDLSVVKFMSDTMAVMKDGVIVEYGPSEEIYKNPKETYTRELIEAIPKDNIEYIRALNEQRAQAREQRHKDALKTA